MFWFIITYNLSEFILLLLPFKQVVCQIGIPKSFVSLMPVKWLSIILCLGMLAADLTVWRRVAVRRCERSTRWLILLLLAAIDLFPLFMALLGWLLPDNPLPLSRFGMWVYTLFIITVFFRAALYPFLLFSCRSISVAAGVVCAVAAAVIPIRGIVCGRRHIEVREVTITSRHLPDGFDGFRIVQFSDLHIGTLLDAEMEIAAIVDTVNALRPDLVIFSGDLVTFRYDELDDSAMRLLSAIEAPVWSSIGNHDVGIYVKDTVSFPAEENRRLLVERERAMGWNVVDNTSAWIYRGGDSVSLSGISFPAEFYDMRHDADLPERDLSAIFYGIPDSSFNIAICHLPQQWSCIADAGYGDLTLAGHFHGWQVGCRLFGTRISPAQLLHSEWSGCYERDGRYLYINDGVGYVGMFMRIGTPPEITVFILKKEF